jgi:FtsP/CotA-like multicopper oxidase with cupredoxin domain
MHQLCGVSVKVARRFRCIALVCLSALAPVVAQAEAPVSILANPNRTAAGKLEAGVLNVHLEIVNGVWHPEADDGPRLFVQAFGEAGKPARIPGPMLRMPQGTTVHVSVTNKLKTTATVHGLDTRPGDAQDALDVPAGETRERTFLAGAPGTYFYWARTTEAVKVIPTLPPFRHPVYEDAHLNGAFIVDPPGAVPADRVFVINAMFVKPDVTHEDFEVVSINGKSYPFTELLEYSVGDTIRWRVINPSFGEHPMHLHGAFYKVLSQGDWERDTQFAPGERQSMVTDNVRGGTTMMLEWSPEHAGRWLFHCHFQLHMSSDERVPVFTRSVASQYDPEEPVAAAPQHGSGGMDGMNDMAGLVLAINVKPAADAPMAATAGQAARKIDLIIEPNAEAAAKEPKFSCSVREKNKVLVSGDRAVGPPIFVTRGEPTEITVLNHLQAPTTIHWHGLVLESYYDGVVGGGTGDQKTPAIAPGGSFVARFTPTRAGTFIYHTHAADPNQLTGGIYGALIVLEPGQTFDAEHDKLLVIGTRDPGFDAKRITINGMEQPAPMTLARGASYRLRLINMAANLPANFRLGTKQEPATWRALAKDGADVPERLAKPSDAVLHIASGETYDFEFRADAAEEIPLEIQNPVSQAKLSMRLVVR